jgi:amino acid transporter
VFGTAAVAATSLIVILAFRITDRDPVLHMFSWFSALAVLAIVLVEVLVSVAVIAYFRRQPDTGGTGARRVWSTLVAPIVSIVGLVLAMYLLMSRFGLLAGTAAKGVDPATQSWGLSVLGWVLVALPFLVLAAGTVVGALRRNRNAEAMADLVT